jgi:hypothetical protein
VWLATGAHAQQAPSSPPPPDQIAAARQLGVEGVTAADQGDCPRAIDRLTRAEALFHAPTTLGRLGECQVTVGKLVIGTETLQRVVREPLAPNAPPAFVAAQERAKRVLEQTLPRIGKLRVHVDRPPDATATVKVDGEVMPPPLLDVDRPTDPGAHTVEASAPGFRTVEKQIAVAPGSRADVVLKLEPDPSAPGAGAFVSPQAQQPTFAPELPAPVSPAPVPAPVPPPAPPPAAPPPQSPPAEATLARPPINTPAIVAFGIGGVGVAIGSIFGVLALTKKSSLDGVCDANKDCPASAQSDINALSTNATISTVGFVIGAIGLTAGAIVLLTSGKGGTSASAWLGPGSAGVRGEFQ